MTTIDPNDNIIIPVREFEQHYVDRMSYDAIIAHANAQASEIKALKAEVDKTTMTLGYVYLAVTRLAAEPDNDTKTLVEIMTTIEKVMEKKA